MNDLNLFTNLKEARVISSGARSRVAIQIIQPGMSANRHIYNPEVLAKAAPLYEGTRVYLNHPKRNDLPERNIRDLVGYLENVRPDLNAELVIVKHQDEVIPLIRESIETGRDLAGLSHNVLAEVKTIRASDGRAAILVEAIRVVKSVDIVTEAAAGGKFKRILESSEMMDTLSEAAMLMDALFGLGPIADESEPVTEAQRKLDELFGV